MLSIKEIAEKCKSAYSFNHENYIIDRKTDTYCYIEHIDNICYVIFRGSESVTDFVKDAEISKSKVPYGNYNTKIRIHSGFSDCYESIRIELFERIFKKPCEHIILAGHSLGGAISILCYIDLIYNFHDKKIFENKLLSVYTFGQPKVGNKYFVNSLKRRTNNKRYKYVRVVNGDDIVAKVPTIEYYHFEDELINIGDKKWYKLFSIEDHLLDNYIRNL